MNISTPTAPRGRRTWLPCLLGALPFAIGLWLWQAKAPRLEPTVEVSTGLDDQRVLAELATLGDFDAYIRAPDAPSATPAVLTLPLARGAELLELRRISRATGYRTLRHESPIVRAYAALQLAMDTPEKVKALRPLLVDRTPLARAEFGEALPASTVAETVLEILCAKTETAEVEDFLRSTGKDPKMLTAWPGVWRCLGAPWNLSQR